MRSPKLGNHLKHVISIFVVIELMNRVWQPRSEIRAETVKTRVLGSSLLSSRPSAAILVSERSDRSRSFRSLCIMLYFSSVKLTDCFLHRLEFVRQSPFIDIFYCFKTEADQAQCWMEEKIFVKVSINGFIFCHFNYTTQFPCFLRFKL